MITWRVPALLIGLGLPAIAGASLFGMTPWRPLAMVSALVVLLSLVDWTVAAPAGEVMLRRDGARQVRLGDTVTIVLLVTNASARPMRAVVRDAWVPSAGAAAPYAHALLLDPDETAVVDTQLTPTRRGDRPAVRVTIRSYGPLGFAFRQTSRRRADQLTPQWILRALPEFRSRHLLPEKVSRLRVIEGQVVARGRGQGTEFDSLRDYVIGDDPRFIDWRGSARREHVVVKQWRPERDRRVLCVLDTGRTSAGRIAASAPAAGLAAGLAAPGLGADSGVGAEASAAAVQPARGRTSAPVTPEIDGEPRLDIAIDAALLLAHLAAYAGDRVDLLAVDTQTHANVSASSKRSLPRLLDAMAPLQPALVETDFGRVVAEVLGLERKRALVVLFTTLDPGAVGEGLLPVLPMLVARHRVVVAAVRDPALDVLAAARTDAAAIHTAAAAERGLAELRRVHAALTRYGVTVVDAPAETFASVVADTYLDLKASGRL